ncbi:hypothetical protein HHK36_031051 [Tetracentron sinense]|uniref:ACT domain-containing protein ACR n=1 Tax=Tetracentron sinense TaxID=13715 RepID=A0A835CZ84_TETSI|nr:hypothetical protein HHK36_031051 [Tetracentron sinense]
MESGYRPYFDPEFESLIERIHPPRVCIDNDTCEDCTLVKVKPLFKTRHSRQKPNRKRGFGKALCAGRRKGSAEEVKTCLGKVVGPRHVSTEHTALEITGTDRPGLLSEISAVLADLGYHVVAAVAWTHNTRAACIIYMDDESRGCGPIMDPHRLSHLKEQLENVVGAHYGRWERRCVRLAAPAADRTHTERRLHQLMYADRDFERICCTGEETGDGRSNKKGCGGIHVSIDNCNEKGYSVVNVRSRDRPKLLFDTVCTLTDMEYVVFHAAISSKGSLAEYYIRHMDGCTLDTESERRRVTQCLVAAIERRVSHGLRLDVCTRNRVGLLSDITRVFRENGLSVSRADVRMRGERAIGSFYVTDTSGNEANQETVELVRKEIGGTIIVVNKSTGSPSQVPSSRTNRTNSGVEERSRFSFGSLLWAQLERLSSNFSSIRL